MELNNKAQIKAVLLKNYQLLLDQYHTKRNNINRYSYTMYDLVMDGILDVLTDSDDFTETDTESILTYINYRIKRAIKRGDMRNYRSPKFTPFEDDYVMKEDSSSQIALLLKKYNKHDAIFDSCY
jgi:hypothetical protein